MGEKFGAKVSVTDKNTAWPKDEKKLTYFAQQHKNPIFEFKTKNTFLQNKRIFMISD